MVRVTSKAIRPGAPWAALVVFLWGLQVWAIWGSPFTLEITLLQGVFVLAFVALIFILAQARIDES